MQKPAVRVKLLSSNVTPPRSMTEGSGGFDLFSTHSAEVFTNDTVIISTGVALAIPSGWVGLIQDRSGLATKTVTHVGGVIDADYRGEVKVMLTSKHYRRFPAGERIAQIIFVPVLTEMVIVDELDETDRGENGFGHTGRA